MTGSLKKRTACALTGLVGLVGGVPWYARKIIRKKIEKRAKIAAKKKWFGIYYIVKGLLCCMRGK